MVFLVRMTLMHPEKEAGRGNRWLVRSVARFFGTCTTWIGTSCHTLVKSLTLVRCVACGSSEKTGCPIMFDLMMALWESPTSARAVEKAFPGKSVLVWTVDTNRDLGSWLSYALEMYFRIVWLFHFKCFKEWDCHHFLWDAILQALGRV